MIKYICALPILFSSFAFSSENNNDMGLYRDNNYNVLALAGGYSCSVYRVPNDLSEFDKYGGKPIGTAQLEVTPYAEYRSVMVNIIFDTGTVVTSPRLPLDSTSSESTVYFSENAGSLFAYLVYDTMGVKAIVQNNNKGKEISVGLADCKYDKKQ